MSRITRLLFGEEFNIGPSDKEVLASCLVGCLVYGLGGLLYIGGIAFLVFMASWIVKSVFGL